MLSLGPFGYYGVFPLGPTPDCKHLAPTIGHISQKFKLFVVPFDTFSEGSHEFQCFSLSRGEYMLPRTWRWLWFWDRVTLLEILWESAGGRFRHTLSQPKERNVKKSWRRKMILVSLKVLHLLVRYLLHTHTWKWPVIELSSKIKLYKSQNFVLK